MFKLTYLARGPDYGMSKYYQIHRLPEDGDADDEDHWQPVCKMVTDLGRCCAVSCLENFYDYTTFTDPALFKEFVKFLKGQPWEDLPAGQRFGWPSEVFFYWLPVCRANDYPALTEASTLIHTFRNSAHGPHDINQWQLDLDHLVT